MALALGPITRRRRTRPASRAADEALIRSLYAEHGRVLLGYAYRISGDRQWAEDVVQETLLRAWKNADSLSAERGSIRGWLFTVARNVAADMARARRVRPAELGGDMTEAASAFAEARDHARDVDNRLIIENALASLSPDHRAVLVEVYLNGKSTNEASLVLGIPVGTVKSRTYHALRALRAALGQADEVSA